MQLSLLLPTHRSDLTALSRIAHACSFARPEIEVIVRDNSGDPKKRMQLPQFETDHCRLISADVCPPLDNICELLQLASADFVFILADDDLFYDRMIASLPALIDQFGRDPRVAGMTGAYLIDSSHGSSVVNYPQIEADDVTARLAGYLGMRGSANVLYYSPHRRSMLRRVFDFLRSMPAFFSFHDQIACMLYVLNGKYIPVPRIMYGYDIGPWETSEGGQRQDVAHYRAAGFDPAINKLHWFLCGFEGAVLIRNSSLFPDHLPAQRQLMADQWFSTMFARFAASSRLTFDSSHAAQAERLCQKLRASQGRMSFQGMLTDIASLIAAFAPEKARSYFEFWSAEIARQRPAAAARA